MWGTLSPCPKTEGATGWCCLAPKSEKTPVRTITGRPIGSYYRSKYASELCRGLLRALGTDMPRQVRWYASQLSQRQVRVCRTIMIPRVQFCSRSEML